MKPTSKTITIADYAKKYLIAEAHGLISMQTPDEQLADALSPQKIENTRFHFHGFVENFCENRNLADPENLYGCLSQENDSFTKKSILLYLFSSRGRHANLLC